MLGAVSIAAAREALADLGPEAIGLHELRLAQRLDLGLVAILGVAPDFLKEYENLNFTDLGTSDDDLFSFAKEIEAKETVKPHILVLGSVCGEETRRELRNASLGKPVLFIELNNAPNHQSLAREAKLSDKVLRLLTPEAFWDEVTESAVTVLAGNAEIIKVFENVHFQLKGTPSASEVELLHFLIEHESKIPAKNKESVARELPEISPKTDYISEAANKDYSGMINKLEAIVERTSESFGEKIERFANLSENIIGDILPSINGGLNDEDEFLSKDSVELAGELLENLNNEEWHKKLERSFLSAFVKEHPEYKYKNSVVVSGSARTALAIVGFYCGIKEVISCDFSWTYEHCFPKVHVTTLDDNLDLDVDAIKAKVKELERKDPNWKNYGALVINNPHNASGKTFKEKDVKRILAWVLSRGIYAIDDLAYQNVMPEPTLNGPKTLKQLAIELVKEGKIYSEDLNKVISAQALSKTDCFAGARLAVTEIPEEKLNKRFRDVVGIIKPNSMAILLSYLFYRSSSEKIKYFWTYRNSIFADKMNAIEKVTKELPEDRNPFGIRIQRPMASMYPQMIIEKLPSGLSLDWLASGLAAQGIGMVPLSTFARTAKGFELARKTFRLTLGGDDSAERIGHKTRRMLIDFNRLIAEEEAKYNKKSFNINSSKVKSYHFYEKKKTVWKKAAEQIGEKCADKFNKEAKAFNHVLGNGFLENSFLGDYLPERLELYKTQFKDRIKLTEELLVTAQTDGKKIIDRLADEFYKDDLELRRATFKNRIFDRTVHPTQMYALKVDTGFGKLSENIIGKNDFSPALINNISDCIVNEYLGKNVAISSIEEADELIADLHSLIEAEEYISLFSESSFSSFLSFWGDWDGSTRPSGQGHRLVAAALVENVTRLSKIINRLRKVDKGIILSDDIYNDLNKLTGRNESFWKLLNKITSLTNQLEKRYRSVLPFSIESGRLRRIGMKLRIAKDPLTQLWQHNDSLERKMADLRKQRRDTLEYYFELNKRLRKALYVMLPNIESNIANPKLAIDAGMYKDVLKRFILTPRIHQKLITARDQFSINTTVENITEINEIAGKYGNPGMVLGLQVSMSTDPEALISLDKKLNAERERVLRNTSDSEIPKVWTIPLFEDLDTVNGLGDYLNRVWKYAVQSRSVNQKPAERFTEMICEFFVAGSDLSQQVGQTASTTLYKGAKYRIIKWLAEKGLVEDVRMKLGSGEPMQRQGGYYADFSGKPAFIADKKNSKLLEKHLKESTIKSTEFATSPLHGIQSGGDLRTLQSNISEKMRHLTVEDRAQLLYHLSEAQGFYKTELVRAAEPLLDTRLQFEARGIQELERLTFGKKDEIYDKFVELTQKNFREILYGREEDVVGIHIITYFISRTTPTLRDRPTIRPTRNMGTNQGQKILEKIADTIPLSKHGSMLRAIGHNRAQTMILGVNQLTTGLFRALNQFSNLVFPQGDGASMLADRILPNLPVYEILHTTRIYHDVELQYLNRMSEAYPAGNTAFALLREDIDSFEEFIPLIQKELLRRHGLAVNEFFENDKFIEELLPTLRPDLAVLLQPNLFNTDPSVYEKAFNGSVKEEWLAEFKELLKMPEEIIFWREKIWQLLEKPVKEQVHSFVQLALALNSFSQEISGQSAAMAGPMKNVKFQTSISDLMRGRVDDSMRQFLSAAVQYLTRLPEDMVEVPIDIIGALKDVEKILQIEGQALTPKEQDLLKFYTLQAARLAGENG